MQSLNVEVYEVKVKFDAGNRMVRIPPEGDLGSDNFKLGQGVQMIHFSLSTENRTENGTGPVATFPTHPLQWIGGSPDGTAVPPPPFVLGQSSGLHFHTLTIFNAVAFETLLFFGIVVYYDKQFYGLDPTIICDPPGSGG